jgi:hypothetical protein
MNVVYRSHAPDMPVELEIDRAWVERAVLEPDTAEPDPVHANRTRTYRAIPERDGRVVYERTDNHIRIITLFLDRRRRRRP